MLISVSLHSGLPLYEVLSGDAKACKCHYVYQSFVNAVGTIKVYEKET